MTKETSELGFTAIICSACGVEVGRHYLGFENIPFVPEACPQCGGAEFRSTSPAPRCVGIGALLLIALPFVVTAGLLVVLIRVIFS